MTLLSALPALPDAPSQSPEERLLPNTFLALLHAHGWCTRVKVVCTRLLYKMVISLSIVSSGLESSPFIIRATIPTFL